MTSRAPSVVDGAPAWRRLAISMLIGTIGSAGMWSVVVVLPEVQAEFGVARGDASLPYTLTMLGFAAGNLVIGRFVDRFGIAAPLIVAALALGIGYALAATTTNIVHFALVQGLLIGTATAASFGPLIADVSHWFSRRRGLAVAAAASGNYFAGALWPLYLKDIIADDGWRVAYLHIALISVAIMIPLALLLRRRAPDTGLQGDTPLQPVRRIDLSPRALQGLLIVAGLGCCVAMSMPQVHIVALCADLGYGVAVGAEMLAIMVAGGVVSRLASGFLADAIGGVKTLLIGSALQTLALILYLPFDGLAALYIVSLVFGLSQGGIVPSYAIIVREYLPAAEAGARVGIVIMATVIGMALGGWLSGFIYDQTGSYDAAFINGIAWNLLNVIIMVFILWRTAAARLTGPRHAAMSANSSR